MAARRRRKSKEKRFEFSKWLFIGIAIQTVTVATLSIICAFKYGLSDIWVVLIPAVFAEQATATGFYFWKAKEENKIKLRAAYGDLYENTEQE